MNFPGPSSYPSAGSFLPNEVLFEILRQLTPKDVENCRMVSQKMNTVISTHYKFLPRPHYSVSLSMVDGSLTIEHGKIGYMGKEAQKFDEFDFNVWNQIDVETLRIANIVHGENNQNIISAMEYLCKQLLQKNQFNVQTLELSSLNLTDNFTSTLQLLFNTVIASCKNVLFRDCVLPTSLTAEMVANKSVFDHYRWIESRTDDYAKTNDNVLRKFTAEMKNAKTKRSFMAEVDSVDVNVVCDFIQTWLTASNAAFFNLSLCDCNESWREAFIAECNKRSLNHYCMEFNSKIHNNAHIKVNFVEESNLCRIWPIFDVPARSAGQLICYARYFRDF